MSAPLRRLRIDRFFLDAFGRDVPFDVAYPEYVFLDLETGGLLWVYEDDRQAEMEAGVAPEENAALRERVEAAPDRYAEVPGLSHGDHHEILRAFLDSVWTGDEDLRRGAQEAYGGSIGRWKRAVGDERAVHAYYDFRERAVEERAAEFLRDRGIEPEWR